MTISENHSNGSTAQDRFSGGVSAFRQNRREAALSAEANGDSDLAARGSQLSQSLSQSIEPTGALDRAPSLPSLDMQGLTEPVFPPAGWMESNARPGTSMQANSIQASSMADHPLLRGLLLELPARGTVPDAGWLDRWFEAARSILELLYVQDAKR
jgi:hypothetical protein